MPHVFFKRPAVDSHAARFMSDVSVILPAGDTGSGLRSATGAEGATAPETLRQKDRRKMTLWKAMLFLLAGFSVHRRA